MDKSVKELVLEKANNWLSMDIDNDTKNKITELIAEDGDELIESFYKNLEFGTGGLRGVMGVGSNRMNIYTVGMATQGLCNYLHKQFNNIQISVAIAYDCRNNGQLFAETTAAIFSANNIKVYLFDSLRPTPELSFAVRNFKCQSGVVVTASHNPKEYNGYKVYWDDGAQIIAPHDKNIVNEVAKITNINQIKFTANKNLIQLIGTDIDNLYIQKIKELSLSPEIVKTHGDIKIVYTPIHGTGVNLVPRILKEYGFTNILTVPEQNINDGNFPTVKSPNPEESEALSMALKKANNENADLVMATDPDADRVGIAIKDNNNEFILLNGNQTATILVYYLLSKWKELNKINGKEYIVKTIVTTELLTQMANDFDVEIFDVLTGFKYIADIIRKNEGEKIFIGGGEESYGYLVGEFVRDKDAVIACALIAEAITWANSNGQSAYELLISIYKQYGLYYESLISIVKKGKSGADEINTIMKSFRTNPPDKIYGKKIVRIIDYLSGENKNIVDGIVNKITLPKSNVLQFILEDKTKISIRPSGTEPKIKFYFGLVSEFHNETEYKQTIDQMKSEIINIMDSMHIN